jgi:HrpA-like RNA helicase
MKRLFQKMMKDTQSENTTMPEISESPLYNTSLEINSLGTETPISILKNHLVKKRKCKIIPIIILVKPSTLETIYQLERLIGLSQEYYIENQKEAFSNLFNAKF